jgi:phenylacetate-CoA ligase
MPSLNELYFALPVWAQNAALSAYGLSLRRRRYGGVHRHALETLRRSQWWTSQELEELQLARLNALLTHAGRTVPRYTRSGIGNSSLTHIDQLRELPTLSKDELRKDLHDFVARAPAAKRPLEIHTGGTTGTPLTIYCNRLALQHNYAFFARLREWARIPEDARAATFAGRTIASPRQHRPPYWRHNVPGNSVIYSSYHIGAATIPDYVEHLAHWKPDLIDSYPSSIEPIARYVVAHGIDTIRPKAVITSSETLSAEVRRIIIEAFGAPVFDHYGGAEMAAFISQCEQGSYHVNPEFGIVEILNDGVPAQAGEVGEIVATGFINPTMPLIRYRTGDLAILANHACACGRNFPVIEQLIGRSDDVVITPDGRRVGRLDPIFKAVSSFYEARIVQDAPDHVRVEYVAEGRLAEFERDTFLRELGNRLGPAMRIDLVQLPSIPRTQRGKLRMVVSEITR